MRKRLMPLIAIVLVSLIAVIGYQLGESPSAPAPPMSSIVPTTATPSSAAPAASPLPGTPVPLAETPLPLPTLPPPAPVSQEPLPPLVFAREGQIWRSAGDGAAPQQLTHLAPDQTPSHPSISPDGALIAFVALVSPPITATLPLPTSRLYTMPADGGQATEIWAPAEGILWLPSWSPDGKALYLFANGTQNAAGDGDTARLVILRIDLASRERTVIMTGALDPTIARDGSHMAYLKFAEDGVTMRLEIADLDGHNAHVVVDGTAFEGFYAPRFSPDSQAVYVAAIGGPATDSQGVPLPATSAQPILPWVAQWLAPPTAQAHGAPWDIWRVNLDGSGLRRLTSLNEDLPMVAFSADGTQAALMAYGGIYLMNPDGSNIRRIDSAGDHGGLDWVR